MSAFEHVRTVVPRRIWDGITSRAVAGESVTLSLLELDANAVVPEHNHVNEQVGVLVEGSLSFRIGEETAEIEPGGMWVIPANVPHAVTVGPEGAVIVEVFSPPRQDWEELETLSPGPGRWP
jgi:quercetin dioxygenase-like cupin family protein